MDELQPKPREKAMEDFWGVISDETAKTLHQHVEQSRNEWSFMILKYSKPSLLTADS